jgi:hypothetical protein
MYTFFLLLPHKIVDYRREQVDIFPANVLLLENRPGYASSTETELTSQPGFHPLQSGLIPQFN